MSAHGTGFERPLIARGGRALSGRAIVPGDKSISHRALLFGAMAVGETRIEGLLEGQDVLDTAAAMRALGATVEREVLPDGAAVWRVSGVGVGGFAEPEDVIDYGNSGTGVRLVMGAVATHPFSTTFTGDASLRSRPMGRILSPLAQFGAQALSRSGDRLPLTLHGTTDPMPVEYETPVASAQVKSAVLLAGLNAPGATIVTERQPTRDHTERMLAGFGASVETEETPGGGRRVRVLGQPELTAQAVRVARDPSSAAFPTVAALITPGSEIVLPAIGMNPTRAGLYETLREMGGDLQLLDERLEGGEPVADIRARFSALKGVEVPPDRAPSMIDEYPVLAVAAAFAEGSTVMRGVHELRVKETDRLTATARALALAGVEVEEESDALIVHGAGPAGVKGGAFVRSELDHRIAMAFAVMGLATTEPMTIDDCGPIGTSFPSFIDLMRGLGADLTVREPEA